MNVPIKIEKDNIFNSYLTIINVFLSKEKKLTEQEIEVLGKMLYIYDMYKHLPKEQIDIILFNKLTKEKIRINLNKKTSTPSFENVIGKLRRKGYVNDKTLKISCPKIIDNKIEINIKLEIKE